jgi:hypothetical protein
MQLKLADIFSTCTKIILVLPDIKDPNLCMLQSPIFARKGRKSATQLSEAISQTNNPAITFKGKDVIITGEQDKMEEGMLTSLLIPKLYYKLEHLPFSKIRVMVTHGTLDNQIFECGLLNHFIKVFPICIYD